MHIFDATRQYERWMAQHLSVVKPDLTLKHERLAEDPFVFLRGTFYRWLQLWERLKPAVRRAPALPAVGDLHVENFGTWRDSEGRLVWGVNDVDEAARLPYTMDLVRLATSAVLATRHGRFLGRERPLADAILEGYVEGLEKGGGPIVLAERFRWLHRLAVNDLRDPAMFWRKLDGLRPARPSGVDRVLRAALPDPRVPYRIVRRVAGVGSLGRPRFVAVGAWHGARVAREAKAWLPSAVVWHGGRPGKPVGPQLLARGVRVPDPCLTWHDGWIVRRLSPDCSRIELTELPAIGDEERLLFAMGWETANLHLGATTRRTTVRAHLRSLSSKWLYSAAQTMADAMHAEWRQWRRVGASPRSR